MISDKIKAVEDAWNDEGPVPAYHKQMQQQLLMMWPTLFHAVRELANGD